MVPQVLTLSSKFTRPKSQRVSFPTNGSIVLRKRTTKSFLLMTPSLAFCSIATPLKKITLWYNNKDVVLTPEAMQKMIEFYHNKGIDMLKLGFTLSNLANVCLHKSTDSKFYPSTELDKDLPEKIREDMVGGPSIVFTRKAVVDETFIRKSSNLCKAIVGIDASQL